ncbi:MAG: hypothetical protein ACE5KX_02840, partial [Acidimicrobiia bacterium]
LAACGDGAGRVQGTVVEVEGDLTSVSSFRVRTTDGEELTFVLGPDLGFEGGAPLVHLRDHLRSGTGVVVTYAEEPDGDLVVTRLEDD